MIEVDFSEVQGFGGRMRRFLAVFSEKEREVQEYGAELLLVSIKTKAPVDTGAYRDSWYKLYMGPFEGWKIATDKPQARRLEYGFVSTDSLGRNYAQAARPHVRPAIEEVRPTYRRAYAAMVPAAWRAT